LLVFGANVRGGVRLLRSRLSGAVTNHLSQFRGMVWPKSSALQPGAFERRPGRCSTQNIIKGHRAGLSRGEYPLLTRPAR
jgi:hypothetical protein